MRKTAPVLAIAGVAGAILLFIAFPGLLWLAPVLLCPTAVLLDKALFWRAERDVLIGQAARPSVAAPARTMRILFVGDSILARFPFRTLLPQTFMATNGARPGTSISQIAEKYRQAAADTFHDAVVIHGGINDILGCVNHDRDEETTLDHILDSFKKTIELAVRSKKAVAVVSLLPVTHKFLLPYSGAIRLPTRHNVARVNSLVTRANERLSALCSQYHVEFVDVHGAVTDRKGLFRRSLAAADGYHVNVFGYKAMADVLTPSLLNIYAFYRATRDEAARRQGLTPKRLRVRSRAA